MGEISIVEVVDVLILGQGLAGTALAWHFLWEGARVVVIDRQTRIGSSGIAAGLVTPITGQKFARSWRFTELWPQALSFYRRVETELAASVFREVGMVRLLVDQDESQLFASRREAGEFDGIVRAPDPSLDDAEFSAAMGSFEMCPGGQLDVPQYLDLTREYLRQRGSFVASDLHVSRDVELDEGGVYIPSLGLRAPRMILCQGYEPQPNEWFCDVRFKPAKGEILTLRIPGMTETRVIHRGVWLAPLGDGLFKAGATYDWKQLDLRPTAKGRAEILTKLAEFVKLPIEVVGHAAAVRPIHHNQYPVIGIHPAHPQLGYFNGLGSKGVLHAPYFAKQFVSHLQGRGDIDLEVDLNRKTRWSSGRNVSGVSQRDSTRHVKPQSARPLTELAQLAVQEVLQPGDAVIDATMGNGHDTHFLAASVGPEGVVYAFDIQPVALERTRVRLAEAGLQNVVLINQSHAGMSMVVPPERQGNIAAVMFNLGYLPNGDKALTTRPESTRQAIHQAGSLLRAGGVMTIVAYMGHDGGNAEADAVRAVLDELEPTQFTLKTIDSQPGKRAGPRLFLVKRLA